MSAPAVTPTAFPGFAPGDARYLLAGVNRWRRTHGWTLSHRGWVNASYAGAATIAVNYDEHRDGFTLAHRGDRIGTWPLFPPFYPADSVRQAVDLLVALDILPAKFSSLADTMRRLADELETEAAVHDAPAGSMFLDAGFRIRLTLDGEYEPTGDAR